ncbi:hypothetical protein GHT06_017005 [Daphnia sinensis]|uniref:Uncharacterized protein n=1 Tax=Daphnia sinensis TaxID=1820382 RepID=A0AAD5LGG5_9CRUS|nr:hypothetical protein GHT06_017005 [Daphnia sinensis]
MDQFLNVAESEEELANDEELEDVEVRETRPERSRSPIRRWRRLLGLAAVGTQVRLTNTRPRLLKEPLLDPTNETPYRSVQYTQARGLLEKTTLPSQRAGGKKLAVEEKNVNSNEISLGLAGWMIKGISTADSKAIQEEFKVIFENDKFLLNPPAIDERAARHLKEKSMQTAEAAEKVWLTTQFKVMDIALPLLHILNHVASSPDITPEHPLLVATEAALAQWARAFNHVTRRR